jgi:Terminase RNaseH-like domain
MAKWILQDGKLVHHSKARIVSPPPEPPPVVEPEPIESSPILNEKPSALPADCTLDSYYRSEARPLHELKPHWKEFGKEVSFESWLNLRDRARKDLFWLGKSVLKKDLVRWHLWPCRKMFVQKNFDGVYRLGYTIGDVHAAIAKQARAKEMLFLASRGSFKSTLDGVDSAQWLLNCPDIRILILAGEYKLAVAFMTEIKGYFYRPEKSPATLLHKLFPEYVLYGESGTSESPIKCPARIHSQKEPSLWVNAIVANLSGWHADIRKMDDVITDENSNNPEARGRDGKLKLKIDGTDNLVDEWGFTDIIGTPYYPDDYYGERLKVAREEAPLVYGKFPGWKVKKGFEGIPLKELKADMVDLLFPEKLSFASLRQKLMKNERLFRCQQLCEPAAEEDHVSFTEEVLRAHLVAKAPKEGEMYLAWDWSFSRASYSDYSAGVAGRIVQGDERFDLYIEEIIFGRWKPSELAFQMVQFEKKWKPKGTIVEKSNGAELLQMEIQRQARRHSAALNILWKTPSVAADAKRNRIKGVETLLANDNLWFCGGQWIDETFEQLIRYTGERRNKGRKDDIPDALAYLQFFCPTPQNSAEILRMQDERTRKAEQQAIYSNIFDTPAFTIQTAQPVPMRRQLFGRIAL